jgi:predicted 3-demethylubiquinone-9 3-methyltransferase (glyoxalase superfamily)
VSWQIVPTLLGKLMSGKDAGRSLRVMQAMLKMVKLDIKKLKQAAKEK